MPDLTTPAAPARAFDPDAMARLAAAQARAVARQQRLDDRPGDRREPLPEHISHILRRWWRLRGVR